ncbi:MAG TPA: ATP-binding cassette domain-containing protein [Dehalococcoidia bacterium]|nr:ATP-binding cassette domain-containing protein [Dehalococcoidia bacterium]
MPELRVERVSKAFGGMQALRDVSLTVERGERRAIIGPNGAGKTTLFRVISGELRPNKGAVYLDGRRIDGRPPEQVSLLGVARTFQVSSLFPEKSCLEHVMLALLALRRGQRWWPFTPMERAPELQEEAYGALERVGLAEHARQPAGALAHGDRRQLELAMALAQDPRLLLLDEPLAGLSEVERRRIGHILMELPRTLTVLLIEHDLAFAYSFADRMTVLHHGEVLLEGDPEQVRNDPRLLEVYAGRVLEEEVEAAAPSERESVPAALQISGLVSGYGDAQVLHGVDMEVCQGEVVAVLGRNGMGKTTLLHTIMGLVRPWSGRIALEGRDVSGLSPLQRAQAGLTLVPQGRRPIPGLTPQEELSLAYQPGPWTIERVYQLFPRLYERRNAPSVTLSGGEQQMLAIARALVRNPKVLLMDEPSEGLSPAILQRIEETIQTLRREGMTILLAEQKLDIALNVADRVYVMEQGKVVYEGRPESLRSQRQLLQQMMAI